MNAQHLKKAILQEAIEGRLVPQDPNDEPASALLARIRKEKERLMKEGKLKKKDLEVKPISEDEIPFKIPESWEWVRIKSIFSMQAGKNVTSADINSEQNEVFKYPCYGGNGLRGYVKGYNTEGVFPIVGRQGALCGNVNVASGQFWATEHAVVTDGYGITPYKWQYYFLIALNLNQYATATAQPGLAVSNVVEVPIPLPPLAEQHRIVAKIEELLPKVEVYGKAQDALNKLNEELPERLKKSILQEAIEGRLVPQDPNDEPASVLLDKIRQQKEQLVKKKIIKADKNESIIYRSEDGHWLEHFAYKERKDVCIDEEIPFEIPESWEWVRLGSLLQVVSDGTHKTPKYVPSGIPFLSVQNISSGHLTMDRIKFITKEEHHELIKRVKPTNGDILICRIGTLGKAIKINWDFEFSIFVSLGLLRPVEHRITDHIIFCINSPLGYKWIQDNKVGGGTHTYKINLGDMPNMLLPIPPLNEQHRIVEKLEQLLDGIDKLKK